MRMVRFAGIVVAALLAGCHGRPRSTEFAVGEHVDADGATTAGGEIAELDLTRGAPEVPQSSLVGGEAHRSHFQLVSTLRQLRSNRKVRGVFVHFGSAQLGWARAQEIGAHLGALRDAHKPVICHAEGLTNATLWTAARGCDRIWLSPAGEVNAVGIAAQVIYANRLLTQKLGIDVDFLQIGKFKGAEEPLTRDGPSPEARASLEQTLAHIRESWIAGVVEARGARVREALEDGPFCPEEAQRRGLIDEVGYLDQARADAKSRMGGASFDVQFGASAHGSEAPELVDVLRMLSHGGAGIGRGGAPHVALVRAIGAIAMDRGGGVMGQRAGISEQGLGKTIDALAEDASTRAVVLRIDSPGGSALASDLLWRRLMHLRERKTLVVSIGDMAASGGYYLASTAHVIVAEPTSIVGSIGVVGGKISVGHALEPFGVHVETFSAKGDPAAARRAAYESPLVAWDEPTRSRVEESMLSVYALFLKRVSEGRSADGRHIGMDTIAQSAEGRIFAGDEAMRRQLVDMWGGLDDALATAKRMANLPEDATVRTVGGPGGLLDFLDLDHDDVSDESSAGATFRGLTERVLRHAGLSSVRSLESLEQVIPQELTTFGTTLLPLLGGERALAAVPFAIIVH